MTSVPESGEPDGPRFSIVVETENLVTAGADAIHACLASLRAQTLSPDRASEIVLVDSGGVSEAARARIERTWPALRLLDLPAGTGYYEAKLAGARATSGDVVVFCDSDVEYASDWLESILEPFARDPGVRFVRGETSLAVAGPYTLALLLAFQFPPFSSDTGLRPARDYAANNFAMRRELLAVHQIPTGDGLHHGNCDLHAAQLRRAGVAIWRQPRARGYHAPIAPHRFAARFFLGGHHALSVHRRDRATRNPLPMPRRLAADVAKTIAICGRAAARPLVRLPAALRSNPGRGADWLIAAPIVAAAVALHWLGAFVTLARPGIDFSDWTDRS